MFVCVQIDGIDVKRVERRGGDAIHFLCHPIEEGKVVEMNVDWIRRFDHMQQHSGIYNQFLINDIMLLYLEQCPLFTTIVLLYLEQCTTIVLL